MPAQNQVNCRNLLLAARNLNVLTPQTEQRSPASPQAVLGPLPFLPFYLLMLRRPHPSDERGRVVL